MTRSITLALAAVLLLCVGSAWADGPPSPTLLPPEEIGPPQDAAPDSAEAAKGAQDRSITDDPSYRVVPQSPGRHTTIRRVALVSGVGLAALALWRNAVADDRAEKYDDAIISSAAAKYRDSVRSAERERDMAAAAAALSFSFALLTFVY